MTTQAPDSERPRSMRGRRGLYAAAEWALVRAPLLPAAAAASLPPSAADGSLLPDDPRVRAALQVASTDLPAALARAHADDGESARLRGKLLRYVIRMSTRPTPYGLFSGVGLAEWGDETDLAIGPDPPRTRTRPDMEWLLDLVASLERDPEVRAGLRLVADSAILIRGRRAFSMSGPDCVSVRATGAVRRALELARTPISPAVLAERLGEGSGATPEKVEGLVDELCRQGFLHFDLRPPLTGLDPAAYVRDRLAGIPAATKTAVGLADLIAALAAWDGLALEQRADAWPDLLERVRAVHAPAGSGNLLQSDMALPLEGTRIHEAVGAEAARAAELLLRLSPYPRGRPQLEAYRRAFEARYGPEREVPLLELLDPDLGMGPHDDPGRAGAEPQVTTHRDEVLRELALDAHRDRRLVVELDEELLERLETWSPEPDAAPPSLDMSLFVAASSPEAIDAGSFLVVVGPNLGASAAGRNLGRFADLLGPPARAALEQVAAAEDALMPGRILAEVVYMPERLRLANLAIRPTVRAHEIVFGASSGAAHEQAVPVDELVVGVRSGRFSVRWPAGRAEVVGVQGHMLNQMHAPAAARFLLDVAAGARCQLSPFSWGEAAGFPFLPRVQCGRVVLAPATWRVDRAAGELAAWRERWSVPRHLYLAVGDNRLLLDLEDPDQAELFREELRRLPDGHRALVQEALPGPDDAWLPGPGGGHFTELVVPVTVRAPSSQGRARAATPDPAPVSERVRLRPPGSDWLYLKLYAPRSFEDELIAGPLRSLGQFATRAGLSDGWFFLRYSDPAPHLRVRFHGEPRTLLGPLMQQVCDWAGELVADGACTGFGFDTYEREVERYGGEDGMRAAEAVFIADSAAVADILRLDREGILRYDRTTVAVLGIDDLVGGLGLDTGRRLDLYREAASLSRRDGEDYRRRRAELRELLGRPEALAASPGGSALAKVIAARRPALESVAAWLDSLEHGGRLGRTRSQLCRTYLHMHANRLGAGDQEREALQLLRRTREGLSRSPQASGQLKQPLSGQAKSRKSQISP